MSETGSPDTLVGLRAQLASAGRSIGELRAQLAEEKETNALLAIKLAAEKRQNVLLLDQLTGELEHSVQPDRIVLPPEALINDDGTG